MINDMPDEAINCLTNNQKQLDFDGIEVGVSRQALEEVLDYIRADKVIPEGYALVPIERIDGLKEAILNCAKKKNAAIRSSLGAGSLPEKCRVEVDDLTVVLECARSYLKLQEKNDE